MNKNKILEILSKTLEIGQQELAKMPTDTNLADLGLSSIQFIQFVVALEEEFEIEILDSDLILSNFETLEILYQTLEKYFSSKKTLKKVLICDCDNVLWHGISGEEEIYTDALTDKFQQAVLDLYNRGVLICLCSKNEPENIKAAFSSLKMPLNEECILISKINLTDKATNIKEIALELNLSTDSFVFVDDSKYELDLVSAIIPDITTVLADYSSVSFIETVKAYFKDTSTDIDRTKQYKEQKEREKAKKQFSTAEEFNESLKSKIICEIANPSQALRISELSHRTNQFNLSNARYSQKKVEALLDNENCRIYVLSASDKYGDMGLIGCAIVRSECIITDFFLSCRVFGRGFEKVLLNNIIADFGDNVQGVFNMTDKNKRFKNFYTDNGVKIYE